MGDHTERELERLARKLGGGWCIKRGVMPCIELSPMEAQALERRLEARARITGPTTERTEGGGMTHNHPENVATTSCPECMKEGAALVHRGRRGFALEDVWSFDCYLAGVIGGGARLLSENLHGCPPELCEDGNVDVGVERWKAILVEIADGFEGYRDADDKVVSPDLERAFDLLRLWWPHLWD